MSLWTASVVEDQDKRLKMVSQTVDLLGKKIKKDQRYYCKETNQENVQTLKQDYQIVFDSIG